MKRLLAYLFIVLGLGLVFSVNGNANEEGLFWCLNDYNTKSETLAINRFNPSQSFIDKQSMKNYDVC